MFPVSGTQGSSSGGGLTEEEVRGIVSTYPGLLGASDDTIQKWIRGNGMYRPLYLLDTQFEQTMNDVMWQSFLLFVDQYGQQPGTLNVQAPTAALTGKVERYDGGYSWFPPPAGIWTWIINKNGGTLTLAFDGAEWVHGMIVASGTYLESVSGQTYTVPVPKSRMALLMCVGPSSYYVLVV